MGFGSELRLIGGAGAVAPGVLQCSSACDKGNDTLCPDCRRGLFRRCWPLLPLVVYVVISIAGCKERFPHEVSVPAEIRMWTGHVLLAVETLAACHGASGKLHPTPAHLLATQHIRQYADVQPACQVRASTSSSEGCDGTQDRQCRCNNKKRFGRLLPLLKCGKP